MLAADALALAILTFLLGWALARAGRAAAVAAARRDTAVRQRAVVRGNAVEQLAPMLPGFRWNPADARWIGKPVDFVVFDGYSAARDGACADLPWIVLVEVKSGRGEISSDERRIRDAVEKGRVRYEVWRVP
ncbi:MAG TPA: Holliday junction resolvase-like protein [Candidatus Thermoplasmatota archaeon]|nr:Holliday junction resolvase-like protein [Candidatus Thermoplasmatota archaeon]